MHPLISLRQEAKRLGVHPSTLSEAVQRGYSCGGDSTIAARVVHSYTNRGRQERVVGFIPRSAHLPDWDGEVFVRGGRFFLVGGRSELDERIEELDPFWGELLDEITLAVAEPYEETDTDEEADADEQQNGQARRKLDFGVAATLRQTTEGIGRLLRAA